MVGQVTSWRDWGLRWHGAVALPMSAGGGYDVASAQTLTPRQLGKRRLTMRGDGICEAPDFAILNRADLRVGRGGAAADDAGGRPDGLDVDAAGEGD